MMLFFGVSLAKRSGRAIRYNLFYRRKPQKKDFHCYPSRNRCTKDQIILYQGNFLNDLIILIWLKKRQYIVDKTHHQEVKKKTLMFNLQKTKVLKKRIKKESKKACKREKKYYFCTRIGRQVHRKILRFGSKKIKRKFL